MVRFPTPGELSASVVKVEIEDPLDEEHGPLGKRSKLAAASQQQWGGSARVQTGQYHPLDEPSPLGLRLKKSPSLVELIQMRLRKPNSSAAACITGSGSLEAGKKKDTKSTAVPTLSEKMKASNFPASLLRIGNWECVSRYEGDLVAKCYYAKHKLVWEVLEGGLKSKIEIQWSDITVLKATFPENGPGTLDIVLARQPLFFRETNPQPRKHTLWQATSDFTGGQASMHRRHFLQCQQGLLNKHFEKLIQCDPRLNSLSQKPDIIIESPYFEPRCSAFEDQEEHKCQTFDSLKDDSGSTFQGFHEPVSPCAAPSTSTTSGMRDVARVPDLMAQGTCSPSSVMDIQAMEENVGNARQGPKDFSCCDQFMLRGLRQSMSKQDLVSHLENCISEQANSGNMANSLPSKAMLEEIAEFLLSDSPSVTEEGLMLRVNSFCSLLQKDFNTVQNSQTSTDRHRPDDQPQSMPAPTSAGRSLLDFPAVEGEHNETSACKQAPSISRKEPAPSISRKESFGDLLLNLPRIASLPKFMFNIYEDAGNQAR